MTLPSSGPMTMAMIRDEFGGGNPASLSQYYAGGGLVPAGTVGVNGPVPSSGAISYSHFYGTSRNLAVISVGVASVAGVGWGYSKSIDQTQQWGTASPNTFAPKGGALIMALNWTTPPGNQVTFAISGSHGNDGWTRMNVGGVDFLRAAASYSIVPNAPYAPYTQWFWGTGSNPFGTGGNVPVTFT